MHGRAPVTLQRAGDGVPVLARRARSRGRARARDAAEAAARGRPTVSVWVVAQADPGPVAIDRSEVIAAG